MKPWKSKMLTLLEYYWKTGVLLLSVFVIIFAGLFSCAQIAAKSATEPVLELEENENSDYYKDYYPYELRAIWAFTSEGKSFVNYDVSEDGKIALAFTDKTVGVFDAEMNYLYGFAFDTNGSHGVLWDGENVLILDVREDLAVACGADGMVQAVYDVKGPSNYWNSLVKERTRIRGEERYYCTTKNKNSSMHGYGFYTILEKTDADGVKTVLYRAKAPIDGSLYVNLTFGGFMILWLSAACFIVKKEKIPVKKFLKAALDALKF